MKQKFLFDIGDEGGGWEDWNREGEREGGEGCATTEKKPLVQCKLQ